MNKTILNSLTPHLVALLLFIVISFSYFTSVLEGKKLIAHDTQSWIADSKETVDYNESHDDVTLWTNSLFGGMPNYQISMEQPNNVLQYVEKLVMEFPRPVSNLLLYLICFYILLLAFGFKPWMAIIGSIGFTFASYNFIIIAAGHNSKAITIAYMAPLIGAVFLAFRRKRLLGGILTAFFLSLAIRANHIQIIYYTLIVLLIFAVVEFIYSIREKEIKEFLKTAVVMIAAALLAVGMNATSLLTTYEYSQYTMRGKSNGLTTAVQNSPNAVNTGHGLDKDYITQWSYGVDETMTLLIPNFKGGASGGKLSMNSETAKYLKNMNVPDSQTQQIVSQMPLYWGTQPGTSGPVYLGAIIIFLFVLSLFVVDKRTLWWLIPVIILTLMLSWGRNFMWLTNIFIDYFPMYNKFRTVSMTLVATGFGITLLAFLALKEIFDENVNKEKLTKSVVLSMSITAGICLIFALLPSLAGGFVSPQDAQFSGDYSFLKETLPLDRKAMLRADAWRSLAFILLGAVVILAYIKGFLKKNVALVLLGFFILIDLFPVAKRYLNDGNFENKRPAQLIQPTQADQIVLQDKSQYRVLDATVDIFSDATPSYFHKNIGGYHAAKLRRYQELIENQIQPEIGQLFGAFGKATTAESILPTLESLGVLNMLNLKYIIYNKESAPLVNPYNNGNAWFVQKIRIAANADDEIKLVGEIDTRHELVVDKSLASIFPTTLTPDTTATIELASYAPNHLVYKFNSTTDQVAVFSEIYYDKGWKATINGKEVPYTRVNYLLRAMPLKAGNYEIDFRFDPQSYKAGNMLAIVSSALLLIAIALLAFFYQRKRKTTTPKPGKN
ncbi:MAG TPA: YfhO family protein [Paludibacteraceae bacterium]|nr:YfhO family protein [Paludibacteraceae bacterium]